MHSHSEMGGYPPPIVIKRSFSPSTDGVSIAFLHYRDRSLAACATLAATTSRALVASAAWAACRPGKAVIMATIMALASRTLYCRGVSNVFF